MARIRLEDRGEELWLRLGGQLDHVGCGKVAPAFQDAAGRAHNTVVADLSAVTFVGSQAISMLLRAHKFLQRQGSSFLVSGLSPHVRGIFDRIGLFQIIPEREQHG